MQPCGLTNPARKNLASIRKRVLRGGGVTLPAKRGQWLLMPCDWAPKTSFLREPPLFTQAGAAPRRRNGLACIGPTGVLEQGVGTWGSLRNLRDPAVSVVTAGWSPGLPTPGGSAAPVPSWRGRTGDETTVSPSEGNEVRRDGRQGDGASHSNVEAGELDRRTPRSEGDAVSTDRWRETWRVHRNPWTCPRNNNG